MQKRPREGKRDVEQDQKERERSERFSRERDRWREEGGFTNGRVLLTQGREEHRERDREKGDTFPRIRRRSDERDRRTRHSVDQGYERVMERDIRRLGEVDMTERERDRARRRDMEGQRDYEKNRSRLEANVNEGRRIERGNIDRMRVSGWDPGKKERRAEVPSGVGDQQIVRYREVDRDRERQEQRERGDWKYPPQRRILMKGDAENFSDREDRDGRRRAGQRERHRYTKSEGDTDDENRREVRRGRDNTNEGDVEGEEARRKWKEKERRKEVERQKERETRGGEQHRERINERYTEHYRERDRRERNWTRQMKETERQDQPRNPQERQREERIEYNTEKGRKRTSTAERETVTFPELIQTDRLNSVENSGADRNSFTQIQTQREAPSRGTGLSESDMDNDQWRREVKYKLKDKEREISSENDRGEERELKGFGKEDMKAKKEQKRDKPEPKQRPYRKMWLEPRADREKTKNLQEEYGEREKRNAQRHEEKERERYAQRHDEEPRERYAQIHEEKAREGYAQSHEEKERERYAQRHEEKERERYAQIHEEEARERYAQRHEEEPRESYAQRHEEEAREGYAQIHEEKARERYAQSNEEEPRERYAQRHEEKERERYAQRHEEEETPRNEEDTSADQTCQDLQTLAEDDEQDIDAEFMNDESERRVSNESIEPDDQGEFDASYQIEAEHLADRMESCEIEEESGSERCGQSDREEDSEGEWEERREKITSGDDGFVTVSSGLDDDEADEDTFEDCKEFWDSGDREDRCRQSPTGSLQNQGEIETRMTEVRGDHKVTVFCVVGQTLPRSGSNQNPSTDDLEQEQDSELLPYQMGDEGYRDTVPISDKETEKDTDHGLTLSEENNMDSAEYDKVTTDPAQQEEAVIFTDNTHTEKENNVHTPPMSVTSTETDDHETHPEKREKRHHLKQAEGTAQEKRISAPPHVKWAKNVLSEILGSSEDGTLNIPEPSDGIPSEAEGLRSPALPLYGVVHKPHKHRRDLDPETLPTNTDTLVQNKILIHVEQDSEGEEEPEQPRPEVETDEEAEYYNLPSPDLNSLSSEGEGEKEESSKKNKKQKKKTVWQMISSSSLRDLGHEALGRRRKGIRRTVQKQKDEAKEEEGGRDRRTRVFPSEDEYDDLSSTWSEMDLSAIKGTISRSRTRTSKYYNSQLYQQYSEVVQNRELLHQSNSDSVFVEVVAPHISSSSPCPSPPLARRPLPPLPPVLHSHSLPHTNSVSSLNESLAVPHSSLPRPSSPLRTRSFASSPMLWQDLPGVKNNPETKDLSQDERRLQEVRFEVVTSEASYCSSLDIVVEHFVKSKQLNSYLTSQDKNWLFSRLCDVRALSHSFFTQLEGRVESNIMHFTVCDLIIKHCPRFRAVYVPYLTNQSYQDKTYQRLINENSGFRHTVETLEQSPRCQRLPFRSFLILPFQRITRLKLLVQNILKRTAPKSKEEAQAIKAMKLLEKMIQDSNDSITQMKSIESLVSLNAKVDFECKTLPLISQSRRLVREGAVTELRDFAIKERERTVYIHLFNDYLLVSLPRESGRFTVIDHAPVSELRAENCNVKLLSLSKNVFRLHLANRSLILRTDTQADKLRWISALSRPHPEIDFNTAQDCAQMQCIRAIIAQQPDELSLEKADVLLVLQQSVDGWVEGTRLSDRLRGWVPKTHLEIIKSDKARQSNLIDALKITTATATD